MGKSGTPDFRRLHCKMYECCIMPGLHVNFWCSAREGGGLEVRGNRAVAGQCEAFRELVYLLITIAFIYYCYIAGPKIWLRCIN